MTKSDWDSDDENTALISADVLKGIADEQQPCLAVLSGKRVGTILRLEHSVTVGRSLDADLCLQDEGISRQHCRFVVENGKDIWVEDLGSTNGTVVNGGRVKRQLLADGDRVQLGLIAVLKFSFNDAVDESFQRQMYEAAVCDGLTRAFNKRHFLEQLNVEFAHARRHETHLTLMMFDIDFFKRINDTLGHLAGDAVLVDLAQLIKTQIRTDDLFARYGGEEFSILSRDIGENQALVLGERIRTGVENHPFAHEGKPIAVTVSIGLAAIPDVQIFSPTALIEAADKALYEAKRTGRNRVCFWRG